MLLSGARRCQCIHSAAGLQSVARCSRRLTCRLLCSGWMHCVSKVLLPKWAAARETFVSCSDMAREHERGPAPCLFGKLVLWLQQPP